jgi:ribonuclease kappa
MAILFANNAEALMGSTEDPPDGGVVARTCIGAVIIYAVRFTFLVVDEKVFLAFCGCQVILHRRSRGIELR